MDSDKSKVVSIMSFNSVMEAQLYKALLESAGVTARLQNDIATQIYPPIGMLLPVNILVAEEDQVRAREILGAKFDLDEFHRQSNPEKYVKKPQAKTAAKKTPTAKKTASKKSTTKKTDDAKVAAVKPAVAKKSDAKKHTNECAVDKPAPKKTAKKTMA